MAVTRKPISLSAQCSISGTDVLWRPALPPPCGNSLVTNDYAECWLLIWSALQPTELCWGDHRGRRGAGWGWGVVCINQQQRFTLWDSLQSSVSHQRPAHVTCQNASVTYVWADVSVVRVKVRPQVFFSDYRHVGLSTRCWITIPSLIVASDFRHCQCLITNFRHGA